MTTDGLSSKKVGNLPQDRVGWMTVKRAETPEMMTWEGPKEVFDALIAARNERDALRVRESALRSALAAAEDLLPHFDRLQSEYLIIFNHDRTTDAKIERLRGAVGAARVLLEGDDGGNQE